jgi:hypothetical protein
MDNSRPVNDAKASSPNQRSFQLPDVGFDPACNEQRHIVRQKNALGIGFSLQNRDFRLEVRRLNIRDQAPFKAAPQSFFKLGDLVWRAIAAQHNLLLRIVQRIESVEKLGLCALFADNELDVVHQQDVDAAIALAEFQDPIVPNRVDHFVHEAFGGDVRQLESRAVREDVVTDGVHQMGFSQTHAAVEKQRVIRPRR